MSAAPRQPDAGIAQSMLAAAGEARISPVTADEAAAPLERLMTHAQRDSGQSRRVAGFLLAWWNSGSCGAFELTTSGSLATAIVADMTIVFGLIGRIHRYPDSLGCEAEPMAIVRARRPELGD